MPGPPVTCRRDPASPSPVPRIRKAIASRFGDISTARRPGEEWDAYVTRRAAANRVTCSPEWVAWAPGKWCAPAHGKPIPAEWTRAYIARFKRKMRRSRSNEARRQHLATAARFAAFARRDAAMAGRP